MNNAAPENTAALQEKIAELEQQLKLSDEGVSHLAERCLALEQKVQSYLAAHPPARDAYRLAHSAAAAALL